MAGQMIMNYVKASQLCCNFTMYQLYVAESATESPYRRWHDHFESVAQKYRNII